MTNGRQPRTMPRTASIQNAFQRLSVRYSSDLSANGGKSASRTTAHAATRAS